MSAISLIGNRQNPDYISISFAIHMIYEQFDFLIEDLGSYLHLINIKSLTIYDDRGRMTCKEAEEDCKKYVFEKIENLSNGSFDAFHSLDVEFWKKSDFFNYPPIKSLSLSESKEYILSEKPNSIEEDFKENPALKRVNELELELLKYERVGEPIVGHANISHYQAECDKYKQQCDQLQAENDQFKARIAELENQQGDTGEDEPLTGIQAINQHKKDLSGMARLIAKKLWAEDTTILIGCMADTVYRTVAEYADGMPDNLETVKNWIRSVAPPEAQKRGRPPTKK